ncbi:MAG TPA: hypothetical protein VGF14_05980 [Alphaproteobacteria bacterium]
MNNIPSKSLMSAKTRLPVRNSISEVANAQELDNLIHSFVTSNNHMTACSKDHVIVLRTEDFVLPQDLNSILENGLGQCRKNAETHRLHTDPPVSSVISLKTSDPHLANKQENVARQAILNASITREMTDNGDALLHIDIPRISATGALHMIRNLIGTDEKCNKTLSGLQVSWG